MCWFVLFGGLCLCGNHLPADPPLKVKPVIVWTGTDSNQSKASFVRCHTQKEWQVIWHAHHGRDLRLDDRTCPEIDFDTYMVLAIFNGDSFQDTGLRVLHVLDEKTCLRVRYRPDWYQIGYAEGANELDAKKFDTRSFIFVVLPRFEKRIVIEEDVRSLIQGPPVWKERGQLPAITKK